jgi:hypothetical protein
MRKFFKEQSVLRIILQIFCNLKGLISILIKYRKLNVSCGKLTFTISDDRQSFWVFVSFSNSRTATGETADIFVYNKGFG